MEFCEGAHLVVANTFVEKAIGKKVTFMEAGARPLAAISEDKFNVLDLLLCEAGDMSAVLDIASIREAALGTGEQIIF